MVKLWLWVLSETRAEIKRMSVYSNHQRHGYGRSILTELMQIAERHGHSELYLDTTTQNLPARTLYEKNGFIQIRSARVGRLDVIFYEKKLK